MGEPGDADYPAGWCLLFTGRADEYPLDPLLLDNYPDGTFLFSPVVEGAAGRYRVSSWGNPSNQLNGQIFIVANLSEQVMPIPEPQTVAFTAFGLVMLAFALKKSPRELSLKS